MLSLSTNDILDMIGDLEDAQGQEWLEETRMKIQDVIIKLKNTLKSNAEAESQ